MSAWLNALQFSALLASDGTLQSAEWPYLEALRRLVLSLALGFFIGLERQRRGKEAGARTFAFVGVIGCLGGLHGDYFAMLSMGLAGLLVALLSTQAIRANLGSELTTSAALLVVAFTGVLCGEGHMVTATALIVITAALLAWKESFISLSLGLTEAELRSAILLGVLAFVVYPGLPDKTIDQWGLIDPRSAWVTVLLIAGIGFANYILLKLYGTRAIELTGFFGGLVNSTVTVTALAERVRETHALAAAAYRGVLLATTAMILRNGVLLGLLAPRSLVAACPGLIAMLAASLLLTFWKKRSAGAVEAPEDLLPLHSPFSLMAALKFGLLFLALEVAGTLAQRWLGQFGFYAVSLIGGLISSASSVASAGMLAHRGTLPPEVAGAGAVIASLASALVDLPLVARIARERPLTRRTAIALFLIVVLGAAGVVVGWLFPLNALIRVPTAGVG